MRGVTNVRNQLRVAIDRNTVFAHDLFRRLNRRHRCTQGQQITVSTKATNLAFHNFSEHGCVAEFFTRVNVGHVLSLIHI